MSLLHKFFKDDNLVEVNSHGKMEDNKRPIFRTVVNCSIMAAMAVTIASGAFAPKTVHASELETKSPVAYEQVVEQHKKSEVEAIYVNGFTNQGDFIKISNEGIEYIKKGQNLDKDNLVVSLQNAEWIHVAERIKNDTSVPNMKAELNRVKEKYGFDLDKRLESSIEVMNKFNIPKEIQEISQYKDGVNYDVYNSNPALEQYANIIKEKTGIDISQTDDYKALVNERIESMKDIQEYNIIRDSMIISYASDVKDDSWIFKEDPVDLAKNAYEEIHSYISNMTPSVPRLSENDQIAYAQKTLSYTFKDTVNFHKSMALGMGNRSKNDIGLHLSSLQNIFEPLVELQDDLYKVNESYENSNNNLEEYLPSSVVQYKKDGSYATYNFGILENVYNKNGKLEYTSLPDSFKDETVKIAKDLNLEKAEGKMQELHVGI